MTDTDDAPESPSHRLPALVWVLSAIALSVALGFGIVAPALPIFATNFGVGRTAAGAVISVFAGMRMAAAFGVGRLVDRLGGKSVLATGLMIVAASSALAGLSQTYVQLLVLRGIGGFGSAMFSISAASVMANKIPSEIRGQAMSFWSGAFRLGAALGPVIGAPLITISLRAPFFFYAATLTIGTVVVFAALPGGKRTADVGRDDESPAEGLREAWQLPQYRIALLAGLSQRLSQSARNTLIPLFITQALLLADSWSGYALAITAVVDGILIYPFGRLADSRGRLGVVFIGGVAGAIGMTALATPPTMWVMIVAVGVLGIGSAGQTVGPSALLGDTARGRRGSVIAAYQVTGDIGTVIGPLIVGGLADALGFSAGFGFLAVVCAATALIAVPYMRSERGPGAVSDPSGRLSS